MTRYNLSITYLPKIEGVRNGTIRQTIRESYNYTPKDLVAFHGWQGRPYRSPWSWRTPYFPLTEVIDIDIEAEGIWFSSPKTIAKTFSPWRDLSDLAAADGIAPPTGEALKNVLMGSRKLAPGEMIHAQILRWAPDQWDTTSNFETILSSVKAEGRED